MNDIKKELLHMVDDVTKMKQRIMNEVEMRIEQPTKKPANKFLPTFVTIAIVAALLLIAPKLLQPTTSEQTATLVEMDTTLFELEILRKEYLAQVTSWEMTNEEAKRTTEQEYAQYVLMDHYAKHLNITITDTDIQNAKESFYYTANSYADGEHNQILTMQQFDQQFISHIQTKGYSEEDLQQLYREFIFPSLALQTKLITIVAQDYTKFTYSSHEFVLSYLMQQYLLQNDEHLYYALLETYPFDELRFGGIRQEAVVLQVTDQSILLLNPSSLASEDDEHPYVHWTPRLPGWEFEEGDVVKIAFTNSLTRSDQTDTVYTSVTHVYNMEPLENNRSVRFEVDNNQLANKFHQLSWQDNTTKPEAAPQLVVTDGLHTYSGYIDKHQQVVTWYNDGKSAQISVDKTLQALLQMTK